MKTIRNKEHGFTLPELMIVIVLLGILATIAIPSFLGIQESRKMEAAADQLVGDLRLAQGKATNTLGGQKVEVHEDADPGDPPDIPPESDYTMGSQGKVLEGVRLASDNTVTFQPDGTAKGLVEVTDANGQKLIEIEMESDRGSDGPTVRINTTTSQVTVE